MGWLAAAALPGRTFRPAELLDWGLRTGARGVAATGTSVSASPVSIRRAIGAQTLSWLVFGHHLWLLAVVAGAPAGRSYLVCVAGFAVATVAGLVVTVAPDGSACGRLSSCRAVGRDAVARRHDRRPREPRGLRADRRHGGDRRAVGGAAASP